MKAVVVKNGRVEVRTDYPEPTPGKGEVLVRVLRAGVCETDLQLLAGYLDFEGVLGHEFVGVAESGRWEGRRVVGEINCPCGECALCRRGLSNHCPHRTVVGIVGRDGVFAELVALPERNLHPVPDTVTDDEAVFVEPLAAAFEVVEQVPVDSETQAVVLGDGRLGNLCAQVLALSGCRRVRVVGKHAAKLRLLAELGFETLLREQARPDRSADLVVEATGSLSGLSDALAWVRPRGTVVLKTTVAEAHRLWLAAVVVDELTLVGSRCGPFEPALRALARKQVRVRELVSAVCPLEQAQAALQRARTGDVLKVLLDVAGSAQ